MIDENYIIKVAELMDTVEYPKPTRKMFAYDTHMPIISISCETMEFNIIDGNDNYLELADEFAKYYNIHTLSKNKLKQIMGINENTYRKLLKYCKEEQMINLRYKYNNWGKRKQNQKTHPQNYNKITTRGHTYWVVNKYVDGVRLHFAMFKKKSQAKRMVELLKECDWDYTKRFELKEQVLNES